MNKKGITLVELLIVLVISAILVAAVYRTFIYQQRAYTVQDQVVEMQQNVRSAINKMMREIRITGFGNVTSVLPVNGHNDIIRVKGNPSEPRLTIVGGFKQINDASGNPITVVSINGNQITLSAVTNEFDGNNNRYISIGGVSSSIVNSRTNNVLTLRDTPPSYLIGNYIFQVQAITYDVNNSLVLTRDDHLGGGAQPLADNIEDLTFQQPSTDTIQMTLTARTRDPDPQLGGGDGYRRRQITSTIKLRNLN
jgi:prepilin-type N-terminal cleavage/methylation domain-containing protein